MTSFPAALASIAALTLFTHAAAQKTVQKQVTMHIILNIGGKTLKATLKDSETTRDFLSLLPLTLTLEDYGGTEKITYPSRKLSTMGAPTGSTPKAGDIGYYAPWGNLALFRKDFSSSSGLIILGSLNDGVDVLRRPGNVNVIITVSK